MAMIDSLKRLALKCTDAKNIKDVKGNTAEEVVNFICDNWKNTAAATKKKTSKSKE